MFLTAIKNLADTIHLYDISYGKKSWRHISQYKGATNSSLNTLNFSIHLYTFKRHCNMTQFRFAYLAYFHLTLAMYEIKHENNRYTSKQILRKNNCFTSIALQSTNPIKLSPISNIFYAKNQPEYITTV